MSVARWRTLGAAIDSAKSPDCTDHFLVRRGRNRIVDRLHQEITEDASRRDRVGAGSSEGHGRMTKKKPHGSTLESFLEEDGILERSEERRVGKECRL